MSTEGRATEAATVAARLRASLRLSALAFAATAALLVLQTVVYQLLPYDSSRVDLVATALRFAFGATDLLLLVTMLGVARREPTLRGLAWPACASLAFSVLSAVSSLVAGVLGSEAPDAAALSRTLDGAEPVTSLGGVLLVLLVLRALAPRGRAVLVLTSLVAFTLFVAVGFRVTAIFEPGARSLVAAWAAWLVQLLRLAALIALSVVARRGLAPRAAPDVSAASPYRAAEGGPTRPSIDTPDAAAAAFSRRAAQKLALYRLVFALRVGLGIVVFGFVVLLSAANGPSDPGAMLMILLPLSSAVTAGVLGYALLGLRTLPRLLATRGSVTLALVSLGALFLIDGGAVLWTLIDATEHAYRAGRDLAELLLFSWPFTTLCFGLSLLFVAEVLGAVGERLDARSLVATSRLVQGLVVTAGTAQLALPFALAGNPMHSNHGSMIFLVVVLMGITAVSASVAAVALQVLLVGQTSSALLGHAARCADRPG